MRLLNTHTGKLEWFDDRIPNYAILSHVWGLDEQTFQDVERLRVGPERHIHLLSLLHSLPPGLSAKLRAACQFAASLGFDWIWVDTCCIDKSSSAEISEAISSMFKWYSNAHVCIAYLEDVPDGSSALTKPGSALWRSRWFTRGWTLQELIAPLKVLFVSGGWKSLGTKADLAEALEAITGVKKEVLTFARPLSTISIAERMSWAANRETTRVEDRAYSLLGVFGLYMPTLYGEGVHAFRRLQEELLRVSPDQSLFAWEVLPSHTWQNVSAQGLWADSPYCFRSTRTSIQTITVETVLVSAKVFRGTARKRATSSPARTLPQEPPLPPDTARFTITPLGIRAYLPILRRQNGNGTYVVAILAVQHDQRFVGLVLDGQKHRTTPQYSVDSPGRRLVLIDEYGDSEWDWVTQLDLAHEDAIVEWEEILIASTRPLSPHIIPPSDFTRPTDTPPSDLTRPTDKRTFRLVVPSWALSTLRNHGFVFDKSTPDSSVQLCETDLLRSSQEVSINVIPPAQEGDVAAVATIRFIKKTSPGNDVTETLCICLEVFWNTPDSDGPDNVLLAISFNGSEPIGAESLLRQCKQEHNYQGRVVRTVFHRHNSGNSYPSALEVSLSGPAYRPLDETIIPHDIHEPQESVLRRLGEDQLRNLATSLSPHGRGAFDEANVLRTQTEMHHFELGHLLRDAENQIADLKRRRLKLLEAQPA